jgi:pimeloyl-ACP methyl ester carboxylesterase
MPTIIDNGKAPTVVLVHGAFADGSSWNGVIERLQAEGVAVTAPANPLRGVSIDSAYLAGVFEETQGPVLAVSHSYGGVVVTNAATQAKNVVPAKFREAVAADLPAEQTALMAATQRPLAELAFSEPTGARRLGRDCPHGPSSPQATRRPAPMSSARWPSELAPRSQNSTAHT